MSILIICSCPALCVPQQKWLPFSCSCISCPVFKIWMLSIQSLLHWWHNIMHVCTCTHVYFYGVMCVQIYQEASSWDGLHHLWERRLPSSACPHLSARKDSVSTDLLLSLSPLLPPPSSLPLPMYICMICTYKVNRRCSFTIIIFVPPPPPNYYLWVNLSTYLYLTNMYSTDLILVCRRSDSDNRCIRKRVTFCKFWAGFCLISGFGRPVRSPLLPNAHICHRGLARKEKGNSILVSWRFIQYSCSWLAE